MATVNQCVLTSKITYNDAASGTGLDSIVQINAPANNTGTTYTNGTGSLQITKRAAGTFSINATSLTINSASINSAQFSTFAGDTAFTNIKALYIENTANANSGKTLAFGNAAANSFQGPLSSGATLAVPPVGTTGLPLTLATAEANGWSTSTTFNIKLDAGANLVTGNIVILGN